MKKLQGLSEIGDFSVQSFISDKIFYNGEQVEIRGGFKPCM